jgi:hypothetical protein
MLPDHDMVYASEDGKTIFIDDLLDDCVMVDFNSAKVIYEALGKLIAEIEGQKSHS